MRPAAAASLARAVAVAAVALVACSARPARLAVGPLERGLDAFLAAHPLAAGQEIRADEVDRTEGASYHVVQVCGSERPHRHGAHDLTAFMVRGRGTLVRDRQSLPMRAGDVAVVPRGTVHWFAVERGRCAVALVAFTPPLDAPDTQPVDSPAAGR